MLGSQRNVSRAAPAFLSLPCWIHMGSGICGQLQGLGCVLSLVLHSPVGKGQEKEASGRGASVLGT